MREIKFRVWHPKSKFFSFWGFVEPLRGIFAGIPSSNEDGFDMEWVRNNSQQFTGLLDSKGKEIFEGDIVKVTFPGEFSGVVEYEPPEWRMKTKSGTLWRFGDTPEIIGNIYENKDIL